MERVESGLWRRRRRSRGHKGDELRQVGGKGADSPAPESITPPLSWQNTRTYIHTMFIDRIGKMLHCSKPK